MKSIFSKTAILCTLFFAFSANATWTSYEYRNSDGEYRYGIKNGNDKIPLNQEKRGKADKAAKKMNKNDKGVMLGPDGQGDYRPGGNFPK